MPVRPAGGARRANPAPGTRSRASAGEASDIPPTGNQNRDRPRHATLRRRHSGLGVTIRQPTCVEWSLLIASVAPPSRRKVNSDAISTRPALRRQPRTSNRQFLKSDTSFPRKGYRENRQAFSRESRHSELGQVPTSIRDAAQVDMQLTLRLDPARLRQWHVRLAERLARRANTRVAIEWSASG